MNGRVLIITKCADCPETDCPHRVACGGIPVGCPLPKANNAINEKRYILRSKDHGN